MHPALPQSLAIVTMIRFVIAFLLLIVPTSMMGATLPLVIKSAVAREDRVGGRIGLLYAINTTGAIGGALVAGFYFISEIGVARSFQIAAATNLLIAIVAIAAGYAMPPQAITGEPATAETDPVLQPVTRSQQLLVLWTFFISGLMSLALEIVWFRTLIIFLRPTAYAFTIMLACVLGGIAIGSAIAAPLLQMRRRWLPVLAAIQCGIVFAAVLSFNMLARSQRAIELATPWFDRLGINTYLAPLVVSSLIAMLPTTILLGLAFPIGLALWAGDRPSGEISRRAGTFYSLNVLGAILGSVLAGQARWHATICKSTSSRRPSSRDPITSRLERPNVTLHVDDGRNFLLMNRKKYDVITADIILPRHAGAGSLYSREYYELVRNALADDGRPGDAVERR